MKTIKLFVLCLFSLLIIQVHGQTKNYKGHVITAKGKIYTGGDKVGFVTKAGIIKNAKGKKIAFVDGEGNLVDADTGMKMGRMGKDGKTYHNINGELEYTIEDNGKTCDIFDRAGNKIGNVHSSLKGVACAIHCFENKLEMSSHQPEIAKYYCPMHPEVTGKEGEKCSKCKMDLVKIAKK